MPRMAPAACRGWLLGCRWGCDGAAGGCCSWDVDAKRKLRCGVSVEAVSGDVHEAHGEGLACLRGGGGQPERRGWPIEARLREAPDQQELAYAHAKHTPSDEYCEVTGAKTNVRDPSRDLHAAAAYGPT